MFELSEPQKAIYYMSMISEDAVTNIAGDIFFDFDISVAMAKETAVAFLEKCSEMHTKITVRNGVPFQYIDSVHIKAEDIEVKEFCTYCDYERWAQDDAYEPINIFGCLYRLYVINISGKVGFYCVTHHIINDASSFNLMASFACNYLSEKKNFELYPYTDYLEKEKAYKQSKRFEIDEHFWNKVCSNYDVCNMFNKKEHSYKASRKPMSIDRELTRKIKFFCENNGISEYALFMSVIAVWYSVLVQSEEFFIGSPMINRSNAIELNTFGLFVNTVPIGFHTEPDMCFRELCEKTEDDIMSAFRHQKYNYSLILKDLKRNIKSEHLFDTVVSFVNAKTSTGAHIGWFSSGSQIESLQIHIDDRESVGMYYINYDYQTEKFTEKDIEDFHNHFCDILYDALGNPDKIISELEMLSSDEKQKILYDFNDTAIDYPGDKCVHQLFERQVENNPDKIAVIATDRALTYKELNEEANRIAHSLVEKGIGKGDIVAFMLPRKSSLIAVMLGVLKSGAAYLPVDPDHPRDRIEYMLSDSGAKNCITEKNLSEFLESSDISNPGVCVSGTDICYCIYTSGSTGKPKGTLVTQRNITNYVHNNSNNVVHRIIKEDCRRIISVTTVGFDIFVTESLLPLANGMEIVFADENQAKIQSKLNELIKKIPVDVLQTTPTKMKSLIADKKQTEYLRNLKTVILGGEALDASLVEELKAFTDAEIFNIYGPTETTVWVTNTKVNSAEDITIGKPMANTQIYIVDKHLKPVPIGITGELCIAGDNVGQGYLNNSRLTEEKFIDNPFGEGKMYRTGDLAYWREDGNIVFIGRNDFQVKIRGLRIELGEIENAILSVNGVIQCAVVVRKDSDDRQYICAFYTGEEKEAGEIKGIIGEKLPKYMIPHIFTYLEEMPFTSSGKINRKALPEINLRNIETSVEYVAPETEKEIVLTECICEVLNAEKASVMDNFFDLGGDSLKAIELTARLEAKGYTADVKTIFASKDIRELSEAITEGRTEYVKAEYGNVLPATAAQMRVYTSQIMKPDSPHYNIPSVFKVKELDAERLEKAVNNLIERHESLRTRFENRDGQIVQVIEEKAAVKVEKLLSDDVSVFNTPFELSKAPLIKVGYYENTVMLVIHHIIADGESMNVMFRELNELYMGRELKESVQYGEFAVSDGYTEENESYWLKVFEEEPVTLELRTDFTRPKQQSFEGSQIYELIDISVHNKIISKCKELGITPFVYYMACFSILLSKYSGNEDIVVGTPVSGRSSRYLDTVGMFVNTIALRSRPEGDKLISELLEEIKNSSIEAINNQNYPFGELVKKLSFNTTGRNPVFDVMLAYQSEETTNIVFGDCAAEMLPIPIGGVKCDINFNIMPRETDVVLMAEYCTALYRKETLEKLVKAYIYILEQMLSEDRYISKISAILPDEKQKILFKFNDTEIKYNKDTCVYKIFEENADKHSERTAVVFKDTALSYAELKKLVENYAAKLTEIGIKQKDVVAIHLDRSHRLVAFQLAILKIGAVFMSVDKRYPEDRIRYACKDCNVKMLITDENVKAETTVISVKDFEAVEASEKSETIINKDFCYIIYTSGSTGKPKGCMLTGKGLLNFCVNNNTIDTLKKTGSCIFACVNAASFDYFIAETLLPLTNGFTTVILDDIESTNHKLFIECIKKNSINVLMTTPTRLKIYFNGNDDAEILKQLKCICTSGEPLTEDLLAIMYEKSPGAKIYNPIGPSECSVWDIGGELNREDGLDIHIGKPIANAQIYITDKYLNLVPIGVTGEICIAGDGVGAGYINNPEFTAEKFIDNPFGEGKLYRTGDLAYWREDGNIVFVGRNDFQVKIRGLRIELGEIENEISRIDGITTTVVVVRKDEDGRQFICAFYTGEKKDAKELRQLAGKNLPQYMIPHIFTHLEEMPLTSTGKANRKALPEIDFTNISEETECRFADTKEERALEAAVKAVLRTSSVNMYDNFFNVGGDSIKAIHIVSQLEDAGYELRVADIMQKETFADIAKAMTENSDKAVYEQNEVNGFVPFSPIMRAAVNENGNIPKNFTHTCIISAECNEAEAKKAFDALVLHHDILRGSFTSEGIEVFSLSEREVYSFHSIVIDDTDEAKEYLNSAEVDTDKLVNILFCYTKNESLIRITVHHFLIDLVSWEILIKDFYTVLEQIRNNIKITLPAKTASFMLWTKELQRYAETISENRRKYWEDIDFKLNRAKSLFAQGESENDAEEYTAIIDGDILNKLTDKAGKTFGIRINEVLLTAVGLAGTEIAGGDVGVIVESHGRIGMGEHISVDRTVGWFTACYPVIVSYNLNIEEELIRIKDAVRKTPENGMDYLLLSPQFSENAEIVFNFYNAGKRYIDESNQVLDFNSQGTIFKNRISVDCVVSDDDLQINIIVGKGRHTKGISEVLGKNLVKQFEKIIDVCSTKDTVVKSCSDFSDESLTEVELNEIKKLFDSEDNILDIYSAAPLQEGMYAQHFRSDETRSNHIHGASRIGKDTDLATLEKSVELLSCRHPLLKTAVVALKSSGAIKQVVLENRKPEFTVLRLSENYTQNMLDRIIAEERKNTLDLQNDSLFRITVVDFFDERFMLVYAHHIILDGWCIPVIINDLQKYYGQLSEGIAEGVLISEIDKEILSQTSYAQYVKWIRSQDKKMATSYWQSLLADYSVAHIFDKENKNNIYGENVAVIETTLQEDLSQNIEKFAKNRHVSPNTIFECILAVVLQKYSGTDDIVFNKVISGRSIQLKNINNTVGPFINTVPVRVITDENSTVSDLIGNIQDQTVMANQNGMLTLTETYKISNIPAKSVDVLFVFENYFTGDISEIENGAIAPRLLSVNEETGFNLTLTVFKESDTYKIKTSYVKDLYTEGEMSGFIDGYVHVLEAYLDETQKIGKISVMSDEAKQTLFCEFNDTEHCYSTPDDSTICSLFEKTAAENKDKVCIKTFEKNLTFGELLEISKNLDARLRKITNGKKSVVAVIAERSSEMYSAIYGIIRGGNAYLPVDPQYPQDRIDYILRDSNAAAVVAQDKYVCLAGNVPVIDMTAFLIDGYKETNINECAAYSDDTAYVIYTSGSTGNPKGAKVSHKSAINRILWMHDKYPLGVNNVILQKTPYTFDVSVWEIFWWALCGGSLAASKPDEHFLPAKILDEVHNNKVTHIHFVPSVFELFLNYLESHETDRNKFETVKYVFLSGEALSASLVQRFYNIFDCNRVTLHNLYGPTECAIDVTYYDCMPTDVDPVPIGKPIYNTQMYVVDKHNNPVPDGVMGELCIAGVNVGQGYINNPELTAERFIDNPFGKGKLYKTGDLAYWREDGNIVFCGRIDNQIKLNGQRIEISEIEAVISEVDGVESIAVVINKTAGRDVLVAFFTGECENDDTIRERCLSKLPRYMVPGAFVHLERLPLNQSGKLDRKALSSEYIDFAQLDESEAPINDAERLICEAFGKILGKESIGRYSDFFDLGGTSLSMISLLSEKEFENISAAEFIRNSNPFKLSLLINNRKKENYEYLEALYINEKSDKVMILLPFAGGGVEAYSRLVNNIKERKSNISLYFIRYLHSAEECRKAANEIAGTFRGKEIEFYSHCVGSAVAIQIIRELEASGADVRNYFAGASIPPAKPTRRNIWNSVPDKLLKAILSKAGAKLSNLSQEILTEMLKSFRKDTDFAGASYCETEIKIKTPVTVVISKKDIFTRNYRQAEKCWSIYAENIKGIKFIDSKSHYFQSDDAEVLANQINI